MSTPSSRLQLARERAGFATATDAARRFGWNENTYRSHENGNRDISRKAASMYADSFKTSAGWILYAEGGEPQQSPAAPPPPPQRLDMSPVPQLSPQRIPVYGRAVGGDDGRFLFNGEIIDTVLTPPGLENVPGAYAVYVSGDSMYPRFEDGETVWVHPRRPPKKNDDVVVQLHPAEEGEPAEGYVKRFLGWTPSQLRLLEFNPMREFEIDRKLVKEVQVIVFSQKV